MAVSEVRLLDAFRVGRSIGRMLVMDPHEDFRITPSKRLFDLAKMDGALLNQVVREKRADYTTAPFDPAGARLKFYPGGLTIWSGFPGAGKTTLLRQTICHFLYGGSSVFLASLEEHAEEVVVNLAATAAGRDFPTDHQTQWLIDAYASRLRLWGVQAESDHQTLLAAIRQCASEGVKHAIIDSLMRLDIANDDFEGQRKFANLVALTAQTSNIHIHLVAHPRKLISANQEPDINDVAGAREIGGVADNVLFIRRSSNEGAVSKDCRPMMVAIRKQRHGTGEVGDISGWFHPAMRQFHTEQFPRAPTRYLPDDAYNNPGAT